MSGPPKEGKPAGVDRLAICPECREGRHVYCLDDGTTTWTDRCKCECGDTRPDGRPNLKLARLDSGATEGDA